MKKKTSSIKKICYTIKNFVSQLIVLISASIIYIKDFLEKKKKKILLAEI